MPGLTFARHDFLVRISARNGEAIALTLDWGGKQTTGQLFTVDAPLALSDQPSMDPLTGLFSSLDIAREFEAFRHSVQPASAGNLNRITLQVDDARLAGVAWETFLRREAVTKPNIVDIPIVRVSPRSRSRSRCAFSSWAGRQSTSSSASRSHSAELT